MLKIVLTGGPCSGKTSMTSKLIQILEERSYKVFTVPEAATMLILNGIKPSKNISMEEFQKFVLDAQLANEEFFNNASKYYDNDKVIVFYDRGIMDSCAYVDKEKIFKGLLEEKGLTFFDVYSRYDAVLHLVTAADGAEEFYQWNDPNKEGVGNNAARSESPEEARIKDKKTLDAWIGHHHLRVFDNTTSFEEKMKKVIDEVFALLGEPLPSEIERKFLIKKPSLDEIAKLGCISKTNIVQTYLTRDENTSERRIRQRGTKEDGFSFYYTEKTDVSSGIRIEREQKITPERYLQLMTEIDSSLHQILKTRYCFIYEKQYFEMDLYPFSDEYAILEIELNKIDDKINLPPLTVLKEVTDDKSFRNYSLAKTLTFNTEGISIPESVPEKIEWIYETGRDEPEILGSGSYTYNVVRTKDEAEAFKLSKEGARNYISRYRKVNGRTIYQWYDPYSKTWF